MSENKVDFSVVPVIIILVFILTLIPFNGPNPVRDTFEFDKATNEGYTAFIVNEYKPGDVTPDDEDDEAQECDGSGFITHGDGHKTPCPGCKNCEKGNTDLGTVSKPLQDFREIMSASPHERDVPDPEIIIAPDPVITIREDDKQIIYFGASWCDFCARFRRDEIPKLRSKGLIVHDEEYADIRTVDVDNARNSSLVGLYKKTRAVPEFVKTVNGEFQSSRTGYMSASQIEGWLND